jgi:hypothetical protein
MKLVDGGLFRDALSIPECMASNGKPDDWRIMNLKLIESSGRGLIDIIFRLSEGTDENHGESLSE